MKLNLLGSHVACEKHLNAWYDKLEVAKVDYVKFVDFRQLGDLLDLNANFDKVCKGCGRALGDDRMVGGDGLVGCDQLAWRWHEECLCRLSVWLAINRSGSDIALFFYSYGRLPLLRMLKVVSRL